MLDAVAVAGRAVAALATSAHDAPACTYVGGIAGPEGIFTSWVGDSRGYWLPDDGLGMMLTEDDTGDREVLTAWLGADAGEPDPQIRSYRPPAPGRLLLCTDGLWRYLPDADAISAALARPGRTSPGDSPLDQARSLVELALDAGGHDNVTALLIRC